jgi:arabinofuranosyltransferase
MQYIRFLSVLFYVLLLTILSWLINGETLIGIDDANIYMVYMRNFANGYGFVYNIGGERVEGFTSLLWTLIGSVFFYISKYPEKFLLLVNVILISYTLYDVSNYLDSEDKDKSSLFGKKSIFFLATIAVTPGFIDWSVLSLMETGLWCFLLTSISLKIIQYELDDDKYKHYSILNFLYILLVLSRPESMLLVPFFILLNLIKEYFTSKSIIAVIAWSSVSSIIFITSLLLLLYWRLGYFGYPLPNTYYAKVSSSTIDNIKSGIGYLYRLFFGKPFLLVIFSFSAWIIFKSILKKNILSHISLFLLFLILGVSLLIPLYSGGDHFGLHRVIMPFIPIAILLGVVVLKELNFFISKTKLILLFFLLFFSNEYNYKNYFIYRQYPISHEWHIAVEGRSQSKKLNDFFKTNEKLPSQGVLVAGGTAFSYNGETIDLLGLNNTKMAHADRVKNKTLPKNHASFNPDVFFELSPDLFWYQNCGFIKDIELIPPYFKVNTDDFGAKVFKNIQLDRRFIDRYGFFRIVHLNNEKGALQIFANKKFVSSLDTSIYKIIPIKYE